MKKIDNKYKQIGLVITFSLCFCMLFWFLLFNTERIFASIKNIIKILNPFIIGFFVAYLLDPIMQKIETNIIKKVYDKFYKPHKKYRSGLIRLISVLISLILFLLFLYALIIMIVPQVIDSISSITQKLPVYLESLNAWGTKLINDNQELADFLVPYTENAEEWVLKNILPRMQEFVTTASSNIIGGVYATINMVFKLIIGLIVSVLLLCNKELYCAQAKKIAYAALREERANNLINNIRFTNKAFGGFLNGKIIDSIVIGILTFIVLLIFKIPYAVLIAVVIGITNIIPLFGPFLGAVPSVIILLMVNPMKALTFVIIILVIQQIDGNIIGPFIIGDSTGLSSFWVIFAITVFGGLFGVFGMFIGVPAFAVIYASIRTLVNERLRKKQLPDSTSFYLDSDYHSDEEIKNTGKEIKFVKKTFENVYVEGKGKKVVVTIDSEETDKKISDLVDKEKIDK